MKRNVIKDIALLLQAIEDVTVDHRLEKGDEIRVYVSRIRNLLLTS